MRVAYIALSCAACSASLASNSPTGDDDGAGGTDASGGGGMMTGGDGSGSGTTALVGPYFTTPMFWNRDVSLATKSAHSDSMIDALAAAGGFGGGHIQIDFSIDVLTASSGTPMRSFTPTSDFYSPDCDHVSMPVPVGGDVEGESGYACTTDGDCHLLV